MEWKVGVTQPVNMSWIFYTIEISKIPKLFEILYVVIKKSRYMIKFGEHKNTLSMYSVGISCVL